VVTELTQNEEVREVEIALLGTILSKPDTLDEVIPDIKSPDYFQDKRHRLIYRAILDLYGDGVAVDLIIVGDQLYRSGTLAGAGGKSYLVEIMELAKFGHREIGSYCNIINNNYRVNRVKGGLVEVSREANKPGAEYGHLKNIIEARLLEFESGTKKPIRLSDMAVDVGNKIVTPPGDTKPFIETRVADLNRLIGGFSKGEVVYVAAPPSMGKTSFALDTCFFNSDMGRVSLFFSIDQTLMNIFERKITNKTGIPKNKLRNKDFTREEEDNICQVCAEIARGDNVFVLDEGDITVMDIRSIARTQKRKYGLDIIVVDYIQQIRPHRRFENRNLEITEISRVLKVIAKELDVVMIGISQLSRGYENLKFNVDDDYWEMPQLTMLRDSGSLEQDGNLIIFPWVPYEVLRKKYGEGTTAFIRILQQHPKYEKKAFLNVAKNKDGDTGVVRCCRDKVKMMFYTEDEEHSEFDK